LAPNSDVTAGAPVRGTDPDLRSFADRNASVKLELLLLSVAEGQKRRRATSSLQQPLRDERVSADE
jgi:hypothetical protein